MLAILEGHTEDVYSLNFSSNGKLLCSGSRDNTIRFWDLSFLYNTKPIDEQIIEATQKYGLELSGSKLIPVKMIHKIDQPKWPQTHPFHWLSKAESGDAEAMVQLGIIYDRDNELEKAHFWYAKAVEAGNERGKERIKVFKQWLTLHQDDYPAEYRKYCLNPD